MWVRGPPLFNYRSRLTWQDVQNYTIGDVLIKVLSTDVRPFPNRPKDESVYSYPHNYIIEFFETNRGWNQRHTWLWESGKKVVQDWIPTYDLSESYKSKLSEKEINENFN